ncbi:uncharacterized protein NECHADRAFT_45721 [Fusarium vanettenii 77-13-4]|uniref:Major facilitator superfamily (MFS) profile domain-containing protein n=1 Tax=Fusarium vanettenii (strain ATCC MYA-4622 / CBS 123669 / FGSC 9596 / NRRL 45880 / 77-13-4) TaxID=660122 RepID=C7ZBF1_FUSV7|nr:uncharacterized protein NECHADRAFT_45721 [Fusarium vanettenii 77-13-4]EEU38728.1 hypothetical protein NECHADRAFT_45721 [Fusarium vanettenii 77-13-4]
MGTSKLALPFKGLFNGRLFFTAAILALSQFNFGFEGSAFTNIQAMQHFAHQFGTKQPDGSVILEAQWLSFFNGFSIVGVIIGNRLTDRFGRLFTVRVMCVWTIICTTVLLTARTSDQMLAGRALNYLYIGMELAVIPLCQAEITPLQARGAMVASYNTALTTGILIMSLSPRWLVLRERHEEALNALRLFREGKFSEEQIQEELASIQAACESHHYKPTEANFAKRWLQIWSRKHIKRTGIVLATNFFLHGTGNAFAGMYGTLFYKSIGTVNPFVLTVVNSVVTLIVSIMTLFLVDMIGRRPLLLGGSSVQASALLIMGGLGMISNPSVTVKGAIIAMMMIFGTGYCASWGQLSHTITAELPSVEVRDLTYATGSLLAVSTQAAMTFGLPYLLNPPYAALGPRVGFIFGSLAAVLAGFAFFCVSECYGKSLEEIDTLFNKKVPIRKFKKAHVDVREESKVGEAMVDHKEFKVAEEAV